MYHFNVVMYVVYTCLLCTLYINVYHFNVVMYIVYIVYYIRCRLMCITLMLSCILSTLFAKYVVD